MLNGAAYTYVSHCTGWWMERILMDDADCCSVQLNVDELRNVTHWIVWKRYGYEISMEFLS